MIVFPVPHLAAESRLKLPGCMSPWLSRVNSPIPTTQRHYHVRDELANLTLMASTNHSHGGADCIEPSAARDQPFGQK